MDGPSGERRDSGLPDKARFDANNETNDREIHSAVTLSATGANMRITRVNVHLTNEPMVKAYMDITLDDSCGLRLEGDPARSRLFGCHAATEVEERRSLHHCLWDNC